MSPVLILLLIAAYLIGSIPFGYLIGRLHGIDPREHGSGNIGATNMVRVLGKFWGRAVFFLDFVKGALVVIVARQVGAGEEWFVIAASVLVILGHNFPVWLRFNGGKGIATSGGVMLFVFPPWVFLSSLFTWLILYFATRVVSIASLGCIVALISTALVLTATDAMSWQLLLLAVGMGILAAFRHRSNIERLLNGTETSFRKSETKQTAKPSLEDPTRNEI